MKSVDEVISELPKEQQELVQKRFVELMDEELQRENDMLREQMQDIINSQAKLAVQSFTRTMKMARQIKALRLQVELLEKERNEWRRVANLAGNPSGSSPAQ